MANKECAGCPVKDLMELHQLLEKRVADKLPAGVGEPLLEAKKQMRLALRGLVMHLAGKDTGYSERRSARSRCISVE